MFVTQAKIGDRFIFESMQTAEVNLGTSFALTIQKQIEII